MTYKKKKEREKEEDRRRRGTQKTVSIRDLPNYSLDPGRFHGSACTRAAHGRVTQLDARMHVRITSALGFPACNGKARRGPRGFFLAPRVNLIDA